MFYYIVLFYLFDLVRFSLELCSVCRWRRSFWTWRIWRFVSFPNVSCSPAAVRAVAAVAVSLFHNTHDACSGYGFPRAQQHSVIGVWDEASAFLLSKFFPRPSSQVVPAKLVQRCSELISKEFCLTTPRPQTRTQDG